VVKLSGWGRYPVLDCRSATLRAPGELPGWLARTDTLIARGNGRAYGDAALNTALTLSARGLDRLIAFDETTGRLTCEAGVLLDDILRTFVPRGWFSPVVPGTKFVTIGGMIAADVHGKNHHRDGAFGRHVREIVLGLADGGVTTCSRERNPALFRATLGGMGLTGVILSATFDLLRIETAWLREETVIAADLDAAMALFEASTGWRYTVAWIDCLVPGAQRGRAVLYRGEHLTADELPPDRRSAPLVPHGAPKLHVPLDAPSGLVNGMTVRLFNRLYYRRTAARARVRTVHYDPFFFPLDGILEWNRLYGGRGFVQYQCVLPRGDGASGLNALLARIAASGQGSFLAVLKLMGAAGEGPLSFPMEGYTLALDFPVRRGTLALLDELDEITAAHGGRVYLAKDARTGGETLRRGYPQLGEFERLRNDAGRKFASAMSERLGL
jgi:FAD/FMN-containing dehydrogenase